MKNKNLGYSQKINIESLCLYVYRLHKKVRWNPSYFRYQHFKIKFTKHFAQKYKGNIVFLVFWILLHILFLSDDSAQLRSLCLINTLLLIPILTYFMTSFVIWQVSKNAIKCHFMAYAIWYKVSQRAKCFVNLILKCWYLK